MADREVDDAFTRSFLRALPQELLAGLRAEGERADYPAGTMICRAGSDPRAVLVVQGLIRVYMTSSEGRQVAVRYARPGDVLGIAVLVGGPANVDVQALEPSGLFRISGRMLTAAARRDARVAWALAEELNRRLYEALQQTAINTFGSVRQRVAMHLLDLASAQQRSRGNLAAHVSQQELADAVGSVREVVARPAEDVFAFLADFENVPKWNYAIEKTRKASPGPVGVGTAYRQTRSIPGRSEEGFVVTVFEPGKRLAVRGQIGPFRARISYLLEAAPGGTRLMNDVALDPSPGVLRVGRPAGDPKGQSGRGGEPQQAERNPGSP